MSVTIASDHDKILIADGKRAITGGRNIATEYFAHPGDAEMVFRDMGVEVVDKRVAAALTGAFEAQYNSEGAAKVSREHLDLQSQEKNLDLAYRVMDAWLRGEAVSEQLLQKLKEQGLDWGKDLARMKHLKGSLTRPLSPYIQGRNPGTGQHHTLRCSQ